jgi:hypothetical protein
MPTLEVDEEGPHGPSLVASAPAMAASAPAARPASPQVDAAALARWLQPATLRHQFMLTEVLQPPLALREERRI